jgi:hypothetical protein
MLLFGMGVSVHARLRRLSVLMLASAGVFLVSGLTLLDGRLRGWVFIVYWLACFGLAFLALIAAFLDLLLVRRAARMARRTLVQRFMGQARHGDNPAPGRESSAGEPHSRTTPRKNQD